MKLIGFRRVDISRRDMEVHGYNLFCTYPSENVAGEVAERLWVSDKVLGSGVEFLRVGVEFTPLYNKYGKIVGVQFSD